MTYPWAITTILTYCAGTDVSCNPGRPEGVHLFKVSDNVLSFDVDPGDIYELVLPINDDHRGLWSKEGLDPVEGSPDPFYHFDPTLLSAFYTWGTFKPKTNFTQVTLRRLSGDNRIGVVRRSSSYETSAVAWLALPFSRTLAQLWNQPLHDAPDIPLPYLTCIVASIFICWARNTRGKFKTTPKDVLWSICNGCLLCDAILWIALGAVVAENITSGITNTVNSLVVYIALFILIQVCLWAHYQYEKVPVVHFMIGFVSVFTSSFYFTTLAFWAWGIALITTQTSKKGSKDTEANLMSLIF